MSVHLHLPLQQEALDCGSPLRLGLVNNMPNAAFAATERQFLSLIAKASAGTPVCVSMFALPGMLPPGQQGRYQGFGTLMASELDGLVVTGREPLTLDLQSEPYWNSFCILLDWARKHTISTIWSCLAAHAAVLHLDGIGRLRKQEKYLGVFPCRQTIVHPLTLGLPVDLWVPHSRWNGLCQEELMTNGYQVLTCTRDGEVDLFTREMDSLFVFAQGHLEYETDTLLREYRRDLGRYVQNQSEMYPTPPTSYFDTATEAALTAIGERAGGNQTKSIMEQTSAVLRHAVIENTWAASAECLYREWLALLTARNEVRSQAPLIANTTSPRPANAL